MNRSFNAQKCLSKEDRLPAFEGRFLELSTIAAKYELALYDKQQYASFVSIIWG
jgi:hypothetical protein